MIALAGTLLSLAGTLMARAGTLSALALAGSWCTCWDRCGPLLDPQCTAQHLAVQLLRTAPRSAASSRPALLRTCSFSTLRPTWPPLLYQVVKPGLSRAPAGFPASRAPPHRVSSYNNFDRGRSRSAKSSHCSLHRRLKLAEESGNSEQ